MKVTAAVARDAGQPLSIEELEIADLGADEVRVRMVATGICHTDATARAGAYPIALPAVFGHEGAGVVDDVGAAVNGLEVGDHVVLAPASCGVCKPCLSGQMAYCANYIDQNLSGRRTARSADGGSVATHFFGQSSFSTYANVVARCAVKVDPEVPLEMLGRSAVVSRRARVRFSTTYDRGPPAPWRSSAPARWVRPPSWLRPSRDAPPSWR